MIQIKLNYSIDVKIYRRRDLIPKESLLKFKGSSFRTFDSIASDSTIVGGVENVGYTGHAIASGDFNDDGSDTRLPTPTAPNKSISSSSPRIITRNSPVMFVPTTVTNDPTSSGHSNSGKSNGKKAHLQRLNTM